MYLLDPTILMVGNTLLFRFQLKFLFQLIKMSGTYMYRYEV